MRIILTLTLVLHGILMISNRANAQEAPAMFSKQIEKDGRRLLYGAFSEDQLFFDFPVWKSIHDGYKPDSALVPVLKECISGNLEILVFLGTWCGDSRREVPIFLKTAKAAGLTATSWKLYGVDVAKKMEGGLIEQYQIKRVPTFIVLRDGKEIGRIVEYTKVSMEADLIEVLKAK
jgi:thiol-disulfide isomerase/thioredoxin